MNKSNLNTKNKIPKSVVEVKDLKVQFQLKDKVVKAVDGISFNINKGGCEDSLNIVKSTGDINKIDISNAYSDALDLDFSDLNLYHLNISKAGNDCLDVSGGNYYINKLTVDSCADKGVSIGEKS